MILKRTGGLFVGRLSAESGTATLLEAAKSGDGAKSKKAANCMGCHSLHKGK